MPSISYTFVPQQSVYVIKRHSNGVLAVNSAIVYRFKAYALATGVESTYDVRVSGETNTTELHEADVFATLNEAIVEYENRLS